jgi:uncharacterized membrane protein
MTVVRPSRWETAGFAVAFAVASLVGLALLWAGDGPYREIIRSSGRETAEFRHVDGSGRSTEISLDTRATYHAAWMEYVTGRSSIRGLPQPAEGTPFFTADERAHMADVRGVFVGAEVAALAAAAALGLLARRAARRGALPRLARNGAVVAAVAVAVVVSAAFLAFDAFFLLFHEVFFPQGNFLFPAGSNLLALYPTAYWYGVTLRIGLTFLALAAAVALGGQVALRRSSSR